MMTAKKRLICIVFALALTAGLFAALGGAALAASGEPVPYVDAQGKTQTVQDPTPLAGDTTAWDGGWYVVQGSVSIEGRITVTGTAHLILADGAKLDAKQGITTTGAVLNIYGQSRGTGTLTASGGEEAAGIGGVEKKPGGTVTVNGGTVKAYGGWNGAGVGGTVTINGGSVTAAGGERGAGIGGSYHEGGGTITINGGSVTATGSKYASGIGGGYDGAGGIITINGGAVKAVGGFDSAGIGGGYDGAGGTVTINGGTVTATGGGGGAGIGGGYQSEGGTVTINGGTITVNAGEALYNDSRHASGIGRGESFNIINDGTVDFHNVGVYAGENGNSAVDVSDIFRSDHSQRFVRIEPRDPVHYMDWDDTLKTLVPKFGDGACKEYTLVSAATTSFADGKWYVVEGNVTVPGRMTVNGAAHLILTDGSTLTAQKGITTHAAALTIHGQSQGTGRLMANGGENTAGIGGVWHGGVGTLTINGGSITATGGRNSAGIGNGYNGAGGTVIINSGTVSADGGIGGAGIGASTIIINSGTVTADGGIGGAGIGAGTIIINGGTLTAASGQAGSSGINSGTVTINDGTVTARGGAGASGIKGTVTINGGTVTANGGYRGAGINGGTVTINGGNVTANSGDKNVAITGSLTLSEGMFLYSGENYVPQVNGDYARSMHMRVNSDKPSSLTVTYDLNGVTGTAPTDTKSYKYKDKVTVLSTPVTRPGCCFKEWNTKADGSGTAFVPGDSKTGSFVITGSTTLYAQWAVPYMDWDGAVLVEMTGSKARADCVPVTADTAAFADGRWYMADSNVTVNTRITVSGAAHLILPDGAKLEARQGITVAEGSTLIIHGQSAGTGVLRAIGGARNAGIGGAYNGACGTVIVNGGSVTAAGGNNAAGIGGGSYDFESDYGCGGGTVTINGGTVTAQGGSNAAGIGGGIDGAGGAVTVNGGSVTATGSGNAAGIGRGAGGAGGTVVLNGGTVTAGSTINGPGISGTVTLGKNMTVWAGNSPDPRTTGSIAENFETNHTQRYVYAALGAPMFTGADLVLDGVLRFRFYVALPGGFDPNGASMEFTVHGRSYTRRLSEAERIDDKYAFTCPVYSIEMAEPVKAVFRYGADGTAEGSLSVAEYLDAVEAYAANLKLSGRDAAALENTLTAVRNYGHYMQAYLAGVHGFTVGEGEGFDYRFMPAASEITPLTELPAFRRVWGPNRYDPDMVDTMQYFDDFDEATTLNIDITLKTVPASVFATVDGKAWGVQDRGGGSYRISIPGIAANNLGKQWHVELTADGKIVYDAKLSALSYVSALLDANRDQPGEREAITAFYRYYEAVKALE